MKIKRNIRNCEIKLKVQSSQWLIPQVHMFKNLVKSNLIQIIIWILLSKNYLMKKKMLKRNMKWIKKEKNKKANISKEYKWD